MTLESAVETYLQGILDRDLDTMEQFFADRDDLTLILPNGKLLRGKKEVMELHDSWFEDHDWFCAFEILSISEPKEGLGIAVIQVDYRDKDQSGAPYEFSYFLSLIFAKNNDEWVVIHDQNTSITDAH